MGGGIKSHILRDQQRWVDYLLPRTAQLQTASSLPPQSLRGALGVHLKALRDGDPRGGGVARPLPSLAVPCSATQPFSQTSGSSRAPPAPLRPVLLSGAAQDAKSTSPWPKNTSHAFWAAKPRRYAHPAAATAIEDGVNITWIFGPPKPRQLCHRWGHLKPPSVAPPSPARG